MKWEVVARPQAEDDLLEAAEWYDAQRSGLGDKFTEQILGVFDALEENPLFTAADIRQRTFAGVIQKDSLIV